jgi:hypothetical protein
MLWHSCNHDISISGEHEMQDKLVSLYVDQEIGPNDKDLSTFDSPLETLGHHFQTRL